MFTSEPTNGRAPHLTERQTQLLKSARAQLNALLEGPGAADAKGKFYADIMKLCGEIERLLGY